MNSARVRLAIMVLLVVFSTEGHGQWSLTDWSQMLTRDCRYFARCDDLLFGATGQDFFISYDEGRHWTHRTLAVNVRAMMGLVESSGDTLIVVGTDAGIYCSRDLLQSSTLADTGLTAPRVVALSWVQGPDNVQWLIAATSNMGILRSSDGGRTWQSANNGLAALNASTVFCHQTLLFGATPNHGIVRSSDYGASWVSLDTTLTGYFAGLDARLYLGTTAGLFASTNNGANWDLVGLRDSTIRYVGILKSRAHGNILIASTDSTVVRSSDGGITWERAMGGPGRTFAGARVQALVCHDTTIIASVFGYNLPLSGARNCLSSDAGRSWEVTATNPFSDPLRFTRQADDLYAHGAYGVWKLDSSHKTWRTLFDPLYPYAVTGVAIGPDSGEAGLHLMVLLADQYGPGADIAYRTSDGGISWREIGLPHIPNESAFPLGEKDSILFTAVRRGEGVVQYNDTVGGLFFSSDFGKTWLRSPTVTIDTLVAQYGVTSIATFPDPTASGGKSMFLSTVGTVFRSRDNGVSWTQDTLGLAVGGTRTLVNWDDKLFLRARGDFYFEDEYVDGFPFPVPRFGRSAIYRWVPDSSRWTMVGSNLPYGSYLSIGTSSVKPHTTYFAADGRDSTGGYGYGYVSNDEGAHWYRTSVFPSFGPLALAGDSLCLSYGGVIFWASVPDTLLVTSVQRETGTAGEFQLAQNYPNPFNPTTTIQYTLPIAGHVRIGIYDLLGRRVAGLDEGYKTAGSYSIRFNGTNLASGVYFYRLEAGTQTLLRKMLLLK
jgi:photosystem II stability/assembly factor-like uncharacterized protein